MPIDIRIRIDLTERQKRVMRAAVVAGTVIGALGIGIAIAMPIETSWIGTSKPVSASSLLANMTELNRRTIATNDAGVTYSVGATAYCGTSPTTSNGSFTFNSSITGYPAAKAICQTSTGCGTSASAHMCTTEEILRSQQLGISVPVGWYSSGLRYDNGGAVTYDCAAWAAAPSNQYGALWSVYPTFGACNASYSILCCD